MPLETHLGLSRRHTAPTDGIKHIIMHVQLPYMHDHNFMNKVRCTNVRMNDCMVAY